MCKTTISLKSKVGRRQDEETFGKKIKSQIEKIKTRIIYINQSTLLDFFTIPIENILTRKTKTCDYGYEVTSACGTKHIFLFAENLKIKNKNKSNPISIFQTMLSDFLENTLSFIKRKVRIPYKIRDFLLSSGMVQKTAKSAKYAKKNKDPLCLARPTGVAGTQLRRR